MSSKENESEVSREEIRAAMQQLIDMGLIVPTGEYRRNPKTGKDEPVYVARCHARRAPGH